jgi:hypothetical protein
LQSLFLLALWQQARHPALVQLQLTLPRALLPAEQFGGAFSLVTNDIKQNIEVSQIRLQGMLMDGDLSQAAELTVPLAPAEVEDSQGEGPSAV